MSDGATLDNIVTFLRRSRSQNNERLGSLI